MMNKIIWKFFSAFVFLTLIVVFVLYFFVSLKLQNSFERKITEKLQSNAVLVGDVLTGDLLEGNNENIQRKIDTLAEKLDLRITVVDMQGKVLGDSDKAPSVMESHKDRFEIIEAVEKGFGQSIRFSDTLNYNMKYVAVRVEDSGNTLGVVRFALPLSEVQLQIQLIYRVVLLGAIVAVVIAFTVAYFLSRSITFPISRMQEAAQRIAKGDFSRKVNIKSKDELGDLAKSLNIMAAELQQKMDNLKRMDRVRTDFVANVSHELKTPLTLIKGYIETLEDRAIDDKEKARKFISIIKEHASRLENIIEDLLSLSELELSKDCLNRTEFDMKKLIDEVALSFGYAIDTKRHEFNIDQQGDDFRIRADRDKIGQVIVNLIDNAIKYTNEAGQINILLHEQQNEITITIRDNGIGIPKEDVDRVFERFYRVDKARSRELGGTGLGLGIAKHIVLAHNGEISIESRINKGTKVLIRLPKGLKS
ncbi:MAG: HAMP domain-containing protein [Planctomycetes bacterium]|nr:HAMP domain-containing protein [Planctomycetota bacterium]MBL7146243.1 HAMP domain-containing protein [Phycisphaerae bacterium]